jgi:hypothetical protein
MFIRRFEDVENTEHFKIVLDGALRFPQGDGGVTARRYRCHVA